MYAYFNDEIIDLRKGVIQLQNRCYTFGDGLYEVLRIIDGVPVFFEEHLNRLKKSADYFKIKIESSEEIRRKADNLIRINDFSSGELYIQLSRGTDFFREHGIKSLESIVSILTIPLRNINEDNWVSGAKVVSFPDMRHGFCNHKTVNLFANVQAKSYAYSNDAYEAIMYRSDSKGKYVTEGGSSNYFFVKNNDVYTPEIDNILPGITREKAISLLREMGENVVQKRFYFDEIKDADEIFLVSTVSKIMPVKLVDNFSFKIGEKTLKLMKRFEVMIREYKKSRK